MNNFSCKVISVGLYTNYTRQKWSHVMISILYNYTKPFRFWTIVNQMRPQLWSIPTANRRQWDTAINFSTLAAATLMISMRMGNEFVADFTI